MKSPESSIPKKCLTCPNILLEQGHIDEHSQEVDELITFGTSDDTEEIASLVISLVEHITGESVPGDVSAKDLAAHARTIDGETMELLMDHIHESEAEMANFAKDCLGSLRLRGSKDGRRVVTAEICMSPRLDDGDHAELANVNRKII